MAASAEFINRISVGYTFKGDSLVLGGAMFGKEAVAGSLVRMPLTAVNRHGLISGATGTGKTKTVQLLAEQLSKKGIPVLLMDIKGDLSGIARPGSSNEKIEQRHKNIGEPWEPAQLPVELLSISKERGLQLRATVSEFGPILFSKILELNENQQGVVAIVFKYCDDKKLPLLDIKDFRSALQYLTGDGKGEMQAYGQISTTSAGVIMRKLLELEQKGADRFFGEKSFEVEDLIRKDAEGRGYISILRLADMQDRPKLFSTFMLCLLAEVYQKFPELGDKAAPKLVLFLDEAHLIFREATKTLLSQLETVVKLIRSKGVGIFFCTQLPGDVPDEILSQLGSKFQHALRAFTANDRKDIRLVASNYPSSEFYKTETLLTELGIGEALVTVLDEKGSPTPLAHTMLRAPETRMDILSPLEQDDLVSRSDVAREYNEVIDRESAYEMLSGKIAGASEVAAEIREERKEAKGDTPSSSIGDKIVAATKNPLVRQVTRDLARGLFGVLFGKPATRRRR